MASIRDAILKIHNSPIHSARPVHTWSEGNSLLNGNTEVRNLIASNNFTQIHLQQTTFPKFILSNNLPQIHLYLTTFPKFNSLLNGSTEVRNLLCIKQLSPNSYPSNTQLLSFRNSLSISVYPPVDPTPNLGQSPSLESAHKTTGYFID
ncbi:hypothetical protein CEXT_341991 [Caerostris extrusa]|uniref:Uncharacterized protein n=1 Tax=Caerostris extrusa TaxID=172846 RepID=A0AAV4NPB2_CAEEX|nr:hypothetical protein CEXT_341991 [Caerostris extrusa]